MWITHQVKENPELARIVAEFITVFMAKENDVREAALIQNTDRVKERRVAEACLTQEKEAKEKAEWERDQAIKSRDTLLEKLDFLAARVEQLERGLTV